MRMLMTAIAVLAAWFSGAWWDRARQGSLLALAVVLTAVALGGCETVRALGDAAREGLVR